MEAQYVASLLEELQALPVSERKSMLSAFEKLRSAGDQLSYPNGSQVQGTQLRELRPRQGRSPWRALYQRVGQRLIVAAIAPEAQHDPRGFPRAIRLAESRLAQFKDTPS